MTSVTFNYNSWELWAPYNPSATPPSFGPQKVTFNGQLKHIIVGENVTTLDIKEDVYSAWKEWTLALGSPYDEAIRTIGGDPTIAGQFAGDIYFLKNGWKLLFDFTKVAVTGVLFSDDFDSAYYDYDVNLVNPVQVSSIVNTVSTGGAADPSVIADAVWDELVSGHTNITTFGGLVNETKFLRKAIYLDVDLVSDGDGSQRSPFNNLTSAIDAAELEGIREIYLTGDITLDRNLKNFTIVGVGKPEVDANGFDLRNTKFELCKLKGSFLNSIVAQNCTLLNGAFLNGFYQDCALDGDMTCVAGSEVYMANATSDIPGTDRPSISMSTGGVALLSIRGYNGGLTITDCDNVADRVTVDMSSGALTFDSTCTAGIMIARGVASFVDSTAGATVTDETINRQLIINSGGGGGGNGLTLEQFIALKD